ncbi:MAG: alpha-ketoglutarate-dependent dioxygenase AlkB [Acidimicrobiales bacterium]|nr:alpha-ketoglutarate-dependent dioxygenase AlkB [Acidimicrobiales bacterium]MCB9392921.1 alpha-ketoglutarate-dependent dioxygenase AlkB [Acidimicrobiaceae bacterium]
MSTVTALPAAYVPSSYQASLFGIDDPWIDAGFTGVERTMLDADSWIDLLPRWMQGSDLLFGELVARLRWAQREVVMYDQLMLEPRLTAWWTTGSRSAEPAAVLADARDALTHRYDKPFDSIGFNLYRDGRDSVAWHADRERFEHEDPVVAIVSLGSPRPFQIRRTGGGPAQSWLVGHGDLLVMGGACQHDWEHAVPKVAHAHGPRLSIMFRHHLAE